MAAMAALGTFRAARGGMGDKAFSLAPAPISAMWSWRIPRPSLAVRAAMAARASVLAVMAALGREGFSFLLSAPSATCRARILVRSQAVMAAMAVLATSVAGATANMAVTVFILRPAISAPSRWKIPA